MAQYYVIRDKNTGLYFRGKGVNRWGKHYNQASIYRVKGMAENTIKEVSWRGEQAEIVPIQIVETSADVTPKSEWISVEDRQPEDTIPDDYKYNTIKVLVAIKGKNGVTIRTQQRFLDYSYREGKRIWTWRFSAGDVTHWMPLPEPPKMKGGD